MARWLLNVTEKYRVDTIEEALKMRDEAQSDINYELQSFGYVTKVDKKFDEEYQVVTLKKVINVEKAPSNGVKVIYED